MIMVKNASYSGKLRWNEIIVRILLILIIDNTPIKIKIMMKFNGGQN